MYYGYREDLWTGAVFAQVLEQEFSVPYSRGAATKLLDRYLPPGQRRAEQGERPGAVLVPRERIFAILSAGPGKWFPDVSEWTGKLLQQVLQQEEGIEYSQISCQNYLREWRTGKKPPRSTKKTSSQ